jgi:type II secretory pathway component GspD/PulD (secretin)
VTHANGDQLGVDLSGVNLRSSTSGANGGEEIAPGTTTTITTPNSPGTPLPIATTPGVALTNTVIQTNVGQTVGTIVGAAATAASGNPGFVFNILEDNFSATVQALATNQKLDVLSRPYILTSDNQEATIQVGEDDPFISDTRVETTGQLVNTIQYAEIGVILDVTPHINPDGLVTMLVNPSVSENKNSPVQITNGVYSPVFTTRSASAQIAIRDGQTIVIGGMMDDRVIQQVNKVPLLGDIPLVGWLFQNNATTKQKQELLFLLSPHVINVAESLQTSTNSELHGLKLVPGAVDTGQFQESLHGLERGSLSTQPSELYIPPIPTTRPTPVLGEPALPSEKD